MSKNNRSLLLSCYNLENTIKRLKGKKVQCKNIFLIIVCLIITVNNCMFKNILTVLYDHKSLFFVLINMLTWYIIWNSSNYYCFLYYCNVTNSQIVAEPFDMSISKFQPVAEPGDGSRGSCLLWVSHIRPFSYGCC